jgi:hypothetical protein
MRQNNHLQIIVMEAFVKLLLRFFLGCVIEVVIIHEMI